MRSFIVGIYSYHCRQIRLFIIFIRWMAAQHHKLYRLPATIQALTLFLTTVVKTC